MPPWCAIVVIFPTVGLCSVLVGLRRGLKAIGLLKRGMPAKGTLVNKEITNTKLNNNTVYKLTFEFTDNNGQTHEAVAKTHQPNLLEDDDLEPLMYDPLNPAHAILIDHLPGSPRINKMGEIRDPGMLASLVTLVLPMVAIIGHGTYAVARFLG